MEKIKSALIITGIILAMLTAAFFWGRHTGRTAAEALVQIDTLLIHDTVHFDKPKLIHATIWKYKLIPVSSTDTLLVHDTIFLHKETKIYQDSLYTAQISGYQPTLDWIDIRTVTHYITRTQPVYVRKRWGIGVTAGYGAGVVNGKIYGIPYIGIGISYNIFQW